MEETPGEIFDRIFGNEDVLTLLSQIEELKKGCLAS